MPTPLKVQIISRYVPAEHRAGHFTYLLGLMRYFRQCGYSLELDVLDPWFLPEHIPQYTHDIAQVFIMPSSFLQERQETIETMSVKNILSPLYSRLPAQLLCPLRQKYYQIQGKSVPGVHKVDAIATEAEEPLPHIASNSASQMCLLRMKHFLANILQICQDNRSILKACIAFDLHHQRSVNFNKTTCPTRITRNGAIKTSKNN